ncbi:hypothetical protein JVU11DRAFT_6607 [Chiua virens]|nr:hypothetical protein JVU11DRAFT_6607 [Chiua virens]
MLPIPDFQFAFYGIATVAATLGYACARRAAISLVSPSDRADVEAGPPEERSLKRKLDDSDENEVDTEEQSRPMKRNRTPPSDLHESDEDFNQEWEVVVAPPPYEVAVGLRQPREPLLDKAVISILTHDQAVTPVREPTPPSHTVPSSQPEAKGVETGRCPTPQPPQAGVSPNEPAIPPPCPITPPKPAPPAKSGSANAFSAFSGSNSPFSSYSNASGASPFAASSKPVKAAPVWRCNSNNDGESDLFGQASPANALAPSPNDVLSSVRTESKSSLGAFSETPSPGQSSNYMTGEEDESVEAELKGVKLFIKRGRKEFIDGMYGHIKLLAQKSSPQKVDNEDSQGSEADTNSRTRLLFRRDPLGQVSMNVGLHPTVRCHFDAAENILRVILMEQVTADGSSSEDVVVYALKPGRVQKADFQSFSKTLCDHEGLKSKAVSSSGNSDDATAS